MDKIINNKSYIIIIFISILLIFGLYLCIYSKDNSNNIELVSVPHFIKRINSSSDSYRVLKGDNQK
jgi:YbbR domain-containing protein